MPFHSILLPAPKDLKAPVRASFRYWDTWTRATPMTGYATILLNALASKMYFNKGNAAYTTEGT